MIDLPSLHQLQYLLAVVELRRFGRAAERCFVTQSTLSAGIKRWRVCWIANGGSGLTRVRRLLALPYPIGKMQREIFWNEHFRVALPKGDRLAGMASLKTDSLPKDELLILEEGRCPYDHALAACGHLSVRNVG